MRGRWGVQGGWCWRGERYDERDWGEEGGGEGEGQTGELRVKVVRNKDEDEVK